MIEPEVAARAREALGDVLGQIDADEIEATKAQRAFIAGAAAALEGEESQPPAN